MKKKKIKPNPKNPLYIIGRILVFIPCLVSLLTASMFIDYTPKVKYKVGDINGDGIVSSADIAYILSFSSSCDRDGSKQMLERADINNDGKVTAYDAYLASKHISSSVTIIDDDIDAFAQTPLVDTNFTTSFGEEPSQPSQTDSTVSAEGYNVISSDKMYIYPDMTQVMQIRDTFVVVTFGWGHGVGMSQWGALGLARAGYSYIQILQHYFNGVAIMKEQYPPTVRCAGKDVNTVEMIARIVQQEISGITNKNDPYDINALRAQAVAAYTNMKYSDYSVSGCSYVSNYNNCREDVKLVASEVAGQYMTYNGNVVYAFYSACSAGVTARYEQVWGATNKDMSYLVNSSSYSDCYTSNYISAEVFSVETMRNYIKSYYPTVTLSKNPAEWIKITEHDDAVNEKIGYVSAMQIGDKTISQGAGLVFRDNILKYGIKSPCFAIIYNGQYL